MPSFFGKTALYRRAAALWVGVGGEWKRVNRVSGGKTGAWRDGYVLPSIVSATGSPSAAEYPANIDFAWTLSGDTYGNTLDIAQNGVEYGLGLNAASATGHTLTSVDPTATFTLLVIASDGVPIASSVITVS